MAFEKPSCFPRNGYYSSKRRIIIWSARNRKNGDRKTDRQGNKKEFDEGRDQSIKVGVVW